jgi:hypothetical protein
MRSVGWFGSRQARLFPLGLLVVTGLGCRDRAGLAPEIEREVRKAKSATVPPSTTGFEEDVIEETHSALRSAWRFRLQQDPPGVLADAERMLVDGGYRCSRESQSLRCSKVLPGDHLDVLVTAPAAERGGATWNVAFTGRPD